MNIVIGFDIGGTNSRAVIARVDGNTLAPLPDLPPVIKEKVASKDQFRQFIRDLLERLITPDRQLIGAVIALAGPVAHHRAVVMTNWPDPREITLEEFVEWGLPSNRTTLINDMEAGCYGLMKYLRDDGIGSEYFEQLKGGNTFGGADGNRVFIAPGTGLGVAGIIEIPSPSENTSPVYPIAAELQHTPMPILGKEQRIVADWLWREKQIAYPTWEDFVSGRGLANIYRALHAVARPAHVVGKSVISPDITDHAAAVAKAGAMGHDPTAREALSVFYACTGRFCQLMALGFQAFGGVFIGGASTIKNRGFIQDSPFIDAFLDNPAQQSLLALFPIYLVTESDLNLDGTLWLGHFLRTAEGSL
ncbi:MAG: glucokinase [Gammaproteobacteria bacterium]|nr:glucokinase [Gammaproteobacteria bacterium]NNJ83926.1 hypothetical protein [Gammaproteobacteria bacterium]